MSSKKSKKYKGQYRGPSRPVDPRYARQIQKRQQDRFGIILVSATTLVVALVLVFIAISQNNNSTTTTTTGSTTSTTPGTTLQGTTVSVNSAATGTAEEGLFMTQTSSVPKIRRKMPSRYTTRTMR